MKKSYKKRIAIGLWIVIAMFLAACKPEKMERVQRPAAEQGIPTLRAFTMGNMPAAGMEEFYTQLDALTIPDLGCRVRFDYIPWGNEKKQIKLSIASDEYDLYVGGGFSDFKDMALKNAFLNLKPYLHLVPDLAAHYSQVSDLPLKLCEINGKLYGIPQLGKAEAGPNEGFIYREDLRKEWGIPPINSLETMEQYLYAAKADSRYKDHALLTDNRIYTSLWMMIAGSKYALFDDFYTCYEYDNPLKVLNVYETPEWKQVCEYAKKWYDDGIIDSDIIVASGNEGSKGAALMIADKKPCESNVPFWSATINLIPKLYETHPEWEIGFYDYYLDNPEYKNAYIPDTSGATAISIAVRCKYPETALKLIEKAHTDQIYYDLLYYGVEGIHYNMVNGVPSIAGISQENLYRGWTGLVDSYMSYETKSVNPEWQKLQEAYIIKGNKILELNGYVSSPTAGFVFNTASLFAQTTALATVRTQYMQPLAVGVSENIEDDLKELILKNELAGYQIYISELQKQWNDFNASK